MGDCEPGLAGAGRPGGENKRVTLERAHVSVLRRSAGAHTALAQIDLVEALARRSRTEVEQRTLRNRQPDDGVDVALHHFVAAFEPLVERFEHAARLLGSLARALERDLIAPRRGGDAKAPFDQSEILPILPEQR